MKFLKIIYRILFIGSFIISLVSLFFQIIFNGEYVFVSGFLTILFLIMLGMSFITVSEEQELKEMRCPICNETFLTEKQAEPFAKRFDVLLKEERQEAKKEAIKRLSKCFFNVDKAFGEVKLDLVKLAEVDKDLCELIYKLLKEKNVKKTEGFKRKSFWDRFF